MILITAIIIRIKHDASDDDESPHDTADESPNDTANDDESPHLKDESPVSGIFTLSIDRGLNNLKLILKRPSKIHIHMTFLLVCIETLI